MIHADTLNNFNGTRVINDFNDTNDLRAYGTQIIIKNNLALPTRLSSFLPS